MLKTILQVNPFPEPEYIGEEVQQIGLMFGSIFILIFLMILMIYLYRVIRDIIPIILVYGFSILIGFESMISCILPFGVICQIFFLIFQSSILYLSSMDIYSTNKNKSEN